MYSCLFPSKDVYSSFVLLQWANREELVTKASYANRRKFPRINFNELLETAKPDEELEVLKQLTSSPTKKRWTYFRSILRNIFIHTVAE